MCRYGAHLSDMHSQELAYCAQNTVVILDTQRDLGIIDALKGHSSRYVSIGTCFGMELRHQTECSVFCQCPNVCEHILVYTTAQYS